MFIFQWVILACLMPFFIINIMILFIIVNLGRLVDKIKKLWQM